MNSFYLLLLWHNISSVVYTISSICWGFVDEPAYWTSWKKKIQKNYPISFFFLGRRVFMGGIFEFSKGTLGVCLFYRVLLDWSAIVGKGRCGRKQCGGQATLHNIAQHRNTNLHQSNDSWSRLSPPDPGTKLQRSEEQTLRIIWGTNFKKPENH